HGVESGRHSRIEVLFGFAIGEIDGCRLGRIAHHKERHSILIDEIAAVGRWLERVHVATGERRNARYRATRGTDGRGRRRQAGCRGLTHYACSTRRARRQPEHAEDDDANEAAAPKRWASSVHLTRPSQGPIRRPGRAQIFLHSSVLAPRMECRRLVSPDPSDPFFWRWRAGSNREPDGL